MSTSWLIDKSALVRLGSSPDAEQWANRVERGLVAISTLTLLEAGFSARSAVELSQAMGSPPLAAMPVEYLTPQRRTERWRCNACWQNAASIARRPSPTC